MSTFQTHTGSALELQGETDFTYQSKGGVGGSSFGQSGPSETANASEWGICVSLLPLFIITEDTGAAEREGIPLNAVFFFALVFPCPGGGCTAPEAGPAAQTVQY